MAEIKAIVRDDPKWLAEEMSEERKAELVRELEDQRELQGVGCKGSNHAAAEDARKNFDKICKQASPLPPRLYFINKGFIYSFKDI